MSTIEELLKLLGKEVFVDVFNNGELFLMIVGIVECVQGDDIHDYCVSSEKASLFFNLDDILTVSEENSYIRIEVKKEN